MIDFNTEFQNFIDDMLNEIIVDLKEKNLEYAGYRMYLKENCAKVREIMDNLPEDEKKIMDEYETNSFKKTAIEQGEFYYRGYRDCIKLLKWLGMI